MGVDTGFPESTFVLTGEPPAIVDSGGVWAGFGHIADDASCDLRRLETDAFVGDEGDLYRSRVNLNLPPCLDITADAWCRVAAAVTIYAQTLDALQNELAGLRRLAYQQWCEAGAASARADQAAAADAAHVADRQAQQDSLDPGASLPPDTYQPAGGHSRSAAEAARVHLQTSIDRAAGIRARHDQAVDTCVRAIDTARSLRFAEPPGWLDRLWNAACDWVAEHVDVLQALSAVLKQISGIAAMLTWIPVVGPLAGAVALTAGGLAVGIDATIKLATGEGDWAQIGIDALSMIPGARAAKAVVIADTTNTAVHVATGEMSLTDAAFSLAANAGSAKMGNQTNRTSNESPRAKFAAAPMGRPAPAEPPLKDQLQRLRTPPPVGYTAAGFEIRNSTTATAIGSDRSTMLNFTRSIGKDGLHDVVMHGTPHGDFALHPDTEDFMHPAQVAALVSANRFYRRGQDVRLVACYGAAPPRSRTVTGPRRIGIEATSYSPPDTPSLAQELADLLGCNVYAGSGLVELDPLVGELCDIVDDCGVTRPELGLPAARPRQRMH